MLQLMRKGCSYTYPTLTVYSQVLIYKAEWKNVPMVLTLQHMIQTWVLLVESPKLYRRAIALYKI